MDHLDLEAPGLTAGRKTAPGVPPGAVLIWGSRRGSAFAGAEFSAEQKRFYKQERNWYNNQKTAVQIKNIGQQSFGCIEIVI